MKCLLLILLKLQALLGGNTRKFWTKASKTAHSSSSQSSSFTISRGGSFPIWPTPLSDFWRPTWRTTQPTSTMQIMWRWKLLSSNFKFTCYKSLKTWCWWSIWVSDVCKYTTSNSKNMEINLISFWIDELVLSLKYPKASINSKRLVCKQL